MKLGPKSKWNKSFWLKTTSESKGARGGGMKQTSLKQEWFVLSNIAIQAKAFKQWVTKDVLPSIRKTGVVEIEVQIQTEQNRTRNES